MFQRTHLSVEEALQKEAGEEPIRFLVIAQSFYSDRHSSFSSAPRNTAMPFDALRVFLTDMFNDSTPPIVAWTDTRVITTCEYDGRMSMMSLPRMPSDCEPQHA